VLRNPSHVVHAVAALLGLLVASTLSVYKPQGVTWYGRRQRREKTRLGESHDQAGNEAGAETIPRTPRWVKIFAAAAIALVLLVVIGQLTGLMARHGSGRHTHPGDLGGHGLPQQRH
jgi:hypothetical protein